MRLVVTVSLLFMLSHVAVADVTIERTPRGAVVKIDGEVFTEYLTKAGASPALWPVFGPDGEAMTRAWPTGPSADGVVETKDHPHHQSIWFTHDKVNGADYWKANVNSDKPDRKDTAKRPKPHIDHREFLAIESGDTGKIIARNDWMNGEERICEDERSLQFGKYPNGDRWIDFTIVLKATEGDLTFGDTKEGTFAVRVADSMRVDAKRGGRIVNSNGLVDGEAWAQPARWVDYSGPVQAGNAQAGKEVISGIAMMSHPSNFRPEPRWHVRTYGLFTANPFGQHEFPDPEKRDQGAHTIKNGDSLALRYRVILHRGGTDAKELDTAFAEFAKDDGSR